MRIHAQVLFLLLFTSITLVRAQGKHPNVVIILTDDQGWGDLSIHGNSNLATPSIDSLAEQGVSMDNFYVCQVCAPTRAEFLTGRYYPRTGVSGVSRGQGRLNPDETTIAKVFGSHGYVTGAFGKWHNGTQPPYHPNNRGFDEFYGFTSGHWGHYFSPPLDHNGRKVRGNGFVVDDFTDHALEFIETNKDRPFFCYVPFNTPHSPMMISDEFYDKFAGRDLRLRHRDPEREDILMSRAALAMVENIDWNVGRILRKLDELNLADDTIVVFFSDNGPNSYRWNGGMKGRKGALDEGGLRSPFFIRWRGTIPEGVRLPQVTGAIDLLPTLTGLVGIDFMAKLPVDGRSFHPLLLDASAAWPERYLFAVKNRPGQVSVRSQRFRLDATGRLFDIEIDRGQLTDISRDYSDVVVQLKSEAQRHNDLMQKEFHRFADRPFTVGYGPVTTLPARDGVEHGTIKRSSKAPNNSFFTDWTRAEDSITWNVQVRATGAYEAKVFYTCAAGDEGVHLVLSQDQGDAVKAQVVEVFDPPLYDKSKERVLNSHYFVKDFQPLSLGQLRLQKGTGVLRLGASGIKGERVVDVHSVELTRIGGTISEVDTPLRRR